MASRDQNARDAMVLFHEGQWYCYYTAHPGRVGRVLCRTSPEIVQYRDEWYIAALMPKLDGIRIAKLKWVERDPS